MIRSRSLQRELRCAFLINLPRDRVFRILYRFLNLQRTNLFINVSASTGRKIVQVASRVEQRIIGSAINIVDRSLNEFVEKIQEKRNQLQIICSSIGKSRNSLFTNRLNNIIYSCVSCIILFTPMHCVLLFCNKLLRSFLF